MVCFDRIDARLSSSGHHSLRATPVSIDRCDVCCAVPPFRLNFQQPPLCLDSSSTENWAPSTHPTLDFAGRNARFNILTPRANTIFTEAESGRVDGHLLKQAAFVLEGKLADKDAFDAYLKSVDFKRLSKFVSSRLTGNSK